LSESNCKNNLNFGVKKQIGVNTNTEKSFLCLYFGERYKAQTFRERFYFNKVKHPNLALKIRAKFKASNK